MERRKFIRNISLGTAATIGVPYLLPTGRLFAATGDRIAKHVVFCLFAGGVRNLESIEKHDGNLMPYTLKGNEAINSEIIDGIEFNEPNTTGSTLQEKGTLYKDFSFNGMAVHYGAHATAITGHYTGLTINTNPQHPTIFELYRKHNDPAMPAKNAWWVSDSEGKYAHLNYSTHPEYGAEYGANYIQPSSFTDDIKDRNLLGDPQVYDPAVVKSIRGFCDANFSTQYNGVANSIINDEVEKKEIEDFIDECFVDAHNDVFDNPWSLPKGIFNSDMKAVHFAERIIEKFQPRLLVVNMHQADIAHIDFTQYASNLNKMDYALNHLWDTIEATPGMSGETILIAMPEHGRNEEGNGGPPDDYGREPLDHTDLMCREIFALVVGPVGKVKQGKLSSEARESIDIVPTIARILGFDHEPGFPELPGKVMTESFF